jgi:peroxiredoxin
MNARRLSLALLVCSLFFASPLHADELRGLDRGDPLPAYRLVALDGRLVTNNPLPGKVSILVYLAAEDRDSERVVRDAHRLALKYGDELQLLFLTADVAHQSYFEKLWVEDGIQAPLALDLNHEMYEEFGLAVAPTTIIADPEGKLAHVIAGRGVGYLPLLDAFLRHAMGRIDEVGLEEELRLRSFEAGSGVRAILADELRRVATGAEMPAFHLASAEGRALDSKELLGRVVVLVYLSAQQTGSERAVVDAQRVVDRLAEEEVELLFVTADVGYRDEFAKLWREAKITRPLYFDPGRKLYGELGLIVFPTTLVVGRDGHLTHVISTRRTNYPFVLDAFLRHALGELDEAGLEAELDAKSLQLDTPVALALRHRAVARLLRDKGLFSGAERELKAALELDPTNRQVRMDLADLLIALGDPTGCLEMLAPVLEKDPHHRRALLIKGIALYKSGEDEAAKVALGEALVLNPDPVRAHYYLGLVYERLGDTAQALEHYREALSRVVSE